MVSNARSEMKEYLYKISKVGAKEKYIEQGYIDECMDTID